MPFEAHRREADALRPAAASEPRGLGGNAITDVWAPLAGRGFNLGIRSDL